MVNRELIRAKVFQLVYAYYMSGGKAMDVALREVDTSLAKTNDLYYILLELIIAITREEHARYNIFTQRALREGTALPSPRFVDNRFVRQLADNAQLAAFADKHLFDWNDEIGTVRRLCDIIEQTETYADYLSAEDSSYDADREVWRRLYKQIIAENSDLDALLEEKSLYWNDDKDIVDTFILKTIRRFDPATGAHQELLPEDDAAAATTFARALFSATVTNRDAYLQHIERASQHWELNRMPIIDIIIMQMAIAEMIAFIEIPLGVTINEYVELAKCYSTPKSALFINAMLDSIAHTLSDNGLTLKQL